MALRRLPISRRMPSILHLVSTVDVSVELVELLVDSVVLVVDLVAPAKSWTGLVTPLLTVVVMLLIRLLTVLIVE